MNSQDQNSADKELIRRALAPPSSASAPPANNKPPACPPRAKETPAGKAPAGKTAPNNTPEFTSKIVEWDDQKGFGFLRHQKGNIFLHRNDFAEHHKRPSKGDRIHYQIGTDLKGRRCAVNARHVNDGGKITIFTWINLILLIAIPALAWSHLMITHELPQLYLFIPLICINFFTYFTYKEDKELARAKAWRTSEATLHLLELIGGWPAALLAQRQFRHKCSKGSFQVTYWLIVLFHIGLAIDYALDWAMFKTFLMLLTPPES